MFSYLVSLNDKLSIVVKGFYAFPVVDGLFCKILEASKWLNL